MSPEKVQGGLEPSETVAIVGASLAGGACITRLRELGFTGRIQAIDCDPFAPYDRPPLSKRFLAQNTEIETPRWWSPDCEVIRARAVAFDAQRRALRLRDTSGAERNISADAVVIATGAQPRRLPIEPDGVFALRTAGDALALRHAVDAGAKHVAVIGAGVLGTEIASSLRQQDLQVSMVDAASLPLVRLLGRGMGARAIDWMKEWNVDLHLGVRIESIRCDHGVCAVTLGSGVAIESDLIISAVGARPAVDWLINSGLAIRDGVLCDASGSALSMGHNVVPRVYVAGDVASVECPNGSFARDESWTGAKQQGVKVAETMYYGAQQTVQPEPPYFWTEQFGRRVQILGRVSENGAVSCVKSVPDRNGGLFKVAESGAHVAWIAINAPSLFAQVKAGLLP
ncbi:MAG: NAD(P)/FAD-dependent oxidoreductase [Aestuariivirga sp.]|nr:NAD(P)/FAD-dependent oxidoreductase [Aestuariivirga sp.]